MIKHIMKDGTTRKDMDGYLVSREACPTAYNIMEGIRNDNGRQADGRKTACQEIQIPGKKGKVSNDERAVDSMR